MIQSKTEIQRLKDKVRKLNVSIDSIRLYAVEQQKSAIKLLNLADKFSEKKQVESAIALYNHIVLVYKNTTVAATALGRLRSMQRKKGKKKQ